MSSNSINPRNWELLLTALDDGRVVPIIGDALIQVKDRDGALHSIDSFLLKRLQERFNADPEQCPDLSHVEDLIESYNARQRNAGDSTDIYYEIYDCLRDVEVSVPSFLQDLFKECTFPLILTTSYAKDIERCLGIAKERTGVYNKSANSDIDPKSLSPLQPFLYYLFGRTSIAKRSFMVTEDDLLDYLHCWHDSDTRPEKISSFLSDKFILILGCPYPNWLFRFFWHSIRNFSILSENKEMQGVVSLEKMEQDRELVQFLSRIQTSVFDSAEVFINELIDRHRRRSTASATPAAAFMSAPTVKWEIPDIFVSYAKEDFDAVKPIVEKMRSFGATVWFDDSNLIAGDEYETMINDKIEQCKRFVPFISRTTLRTGRRFYKKEWNKAISELQYRFDEEYIAPIILDDTDKTNPSIPKPFRDVHIISLSEEGFDAKLKSLIRSFR